MMFYFPSCVKKLIFFIIISFPITLLSQEISTDVETHFPIILKIIPFVRNLEFKQKINFAIIYQENYRKSIDVTYHTQKILENSGENMTMGKINFLKINLTKINSLQTFLEKNQIDICYIAPLRSIDLTKLLQLLHSNKILTTTAVMDYFQLGSLIGIGLNDERPMIYLRLNEAKKYGFDFSSRLLKLVNIVK